MKSSIHLNSNRLKHLVTLLSYNVVQTSSDLSTNIRSLTYYCRWIGNCRINEVGAPKYHIHYAGCTGYLITWLYIPKSQ